ncbi:putative SOS response-associated peptidase YedK [Buttiauxella sp. BIGb0552]|uniref:SOS response-associated peptidase family protein n=1 Tax=Buttiauxella sp. BIGb0552 TaxID=2485120 RepID=UPI001064996A|nr:SOS response-associated peptidase family protein [Buttiauxella sp. BIGb0552]TDX19826.1 putative SOS response-associated peptidase YedK [Buttiauxella sp. BIGb0552]
MCGRFTQIQSRDDYLEFLAEEVGKDIAYDPDPIGRYNVAPGSKVLLLNNRDDTFHLDPVVWSYAPGWWNKPPLINARVETAATSRMLKTLWNNGRAIVFADGWYEWKKDGDKKQPYYIYRKDRKPLFFAAIGKQPFDTGDEAEGFLIVTAAADKGLIDIHDRRPLVFTPEAILEWMNPETSGAQASELAHEAAIPAKEFTWHPVTRSVGNVKNQSKGLIIKIDH